MRIEPYSGPREALLPLFRLAEDSVVELASYLHTGEVLVAVRGGEPIGHLLLVPTDRAGVLEIKNMAVRTDAQGQGVGAALVRAAVEAARAGSATLLLVATAAAGTGQLRFYQRVGFRMRSIERDAFTPANGYPPDFRIDGLDGRDRVWLDRELPR